MTKEEMLEKAADAGRAWMEEVIAEDKWDLSAEMTYTEFSQALCEANDPPFPSFETEEETEEAYDAAFEQLQSAQNAQVFEVEAQDGTIWEVTDAYSCPCYVRIKGTEQWEEAAWMIFCRNEGIEPDCLATVTSRTRM
jgi:hypothetical protein